MKLCTVCGVVTSREGSRCTTHARQSNRSRHNALYSTRAWQRLSARMLRAWRGEHGDWCPGYQRPAHRASDLTVDHVVPLAAGGAPFDIGNTAVLCRSCNSTKGAGGPDRGSPHAGSALPEDRDRIPSGRRYAAVRDYVASRYNAGLGLDELWELVRTQVAPRFEVGKTEPELRVDFERVTAKLAERLGAPAHAPTAPRSAEEISASSIDAADLLELDIPPLAWIVPDLLPGGTTVLAGPPKLGKSCLVYQIAVEVALGGELLGRPIEQGDVLYLALEDGKRRGQTRLRAALGDRSMPRDRLEVRWSAAKLGEGLEHELVDWLAEHPDARLVAIDTLQRVRARGDARRNAYEVDVEDLARLQDIFKDRAVGQLIVHHSKKDAGDDFLASVSGTYGITGSADATLVIQRKRLETFGKLVVTGRDVAEVEEPVQFNGMTWSSAPRSLAEASFEQAEVYKVIEAEGPIFPKAIADVIGSTRDAVQKLVEKLVAGGSVARARGGYVVARVWIDEDAEGAHEAETGRIAHSTHSPSRAHAGGTTSLHSLPSPGRGG